MAVFRVEKTKDFTVMSNHHLRNKELSLKAKGLLSFMLSLPDNWDYTQKGLTYFFRDGEDAISTALKELEKEGYLTRQRIRLSNGRLGSVEYEIHELPKKTVLEDEPPTREKPDQDFPEQVFPEQDFPVQGNTPQLNTKESNTDLSNTDNSIDMIDRAQEYREEIKENLGYDLLVERYGEQRIEELVELMVDTIISPNPKCRIEGTDISRELVRNRLLKIDNTHVEYVFECLDKHTGRIANPKAYLLTALYNAPTTMEQYYSSEANHYEPPTYIRKQRRSDNSTH